MRANFRWIFTEFPPYNYTFMFIFIIHLHGKQGPEIYSPVGHESRRKLRARESSADSGRKNTPTHKHGRILSKPTAGGDKSFTWTPKFGTKYEYCEILKMFRSFKNSSVTDFDVSGLGNVKAKDDGSKSKFKLIQQLNSENSNFPDLTSHIWEFYSNISTILTLRHIKSGKFGFTEFSCCVNLNLDPSSETLLQQFWGRKRQNRIYPIFSR